jgi:hypothetical protein
VIKQSALLEDTHVLEEERDFDERCGHGVASVQDVEALGVEVVSAPSLLRLGVGVCTREEEPYMQKAGSSI